MDRWPKLTNVKRWFAPPTPKILGRLVEIIYEDDKTNPDAAANATRKLRMH